MVYFEPFKKSNYKLKNYSSDVKYNKKRNPLAPETPSRILIIGQTGSGKTNLLLNLIYDLLPWTKLYVYAKNLHEDKYKSLQEVCREAEKKQRQQFAKFDSSEESIVAVDDLDPKEHNLLVFDDFLTDFAAQSKIADLFIRGRKHNATIIYLTQSYFNTPKLVRLQCNYLILFKPSDDRDALELHRNHNCNLSREKFMEAVKEATFEPKHSFLVMDMATTDPAMRLRKNFSHTFSY